MVLAADPARDERLRIVVAMPFDAAATIQPFELARATNHVATSDGGLQDVPGSATIGVALFRLALLRSKRVAASFRLPPLSMVRYHAVPAVRLRARLSVSNAGAERLFQPASAAGPHYSTHPGFFTGG